MTGRSRGTAIAELALWGGAGIAVLAVHVAAAAWLLRTPPVMPLDDLPPAAIMIEFAEVPEAVSTQDTEISPDRETAEASAPAEKVDAPVPELSDPHAETAAVSEPVETETAAVEPVPEPVDERAPVRDKVDVPLPIARPKPPEKKVVREERKERQERAKPPQQAQVAARQALQAQAQVAQSDRNAARQTASGVFSSMTPATWQARLMAHLERRKTYPPGSKARGERGTVFVRFSIDQGGNVLSAALAKSSGFPDLDQEVLSLVRRASPVPAPPPGVNRAITAPVRFNVR